MRKLTLQPSSFAPGGRGSGAGQRSITAGGVGGPRKPVDGMQPVVHLGRGQVQQQSSDRVRERVREPVEVLLGELAHAGEQGAEHPIELRNKDADLRAEALGRAENARVLVGREQLRLRHFRSFARHEPQEKASASCSQTVSAVSRHGRFWVSMEMPAPERFL